MTKQKKKHKSQKNDGTPADHAAFDIDAPDLPDWITDKALRSGNYPYDDRMRRKTYDKELVALQIELLKLQYWLRETGGRLVVVFEGRDSAGKGGTIKRFMQHLMPRHAHVVALAKPTEAESGQWYFQRYVPHLPTAGDITLYDRSWYNRAGVEPVMGFCSEQQTERFLQETPSFETALVRDDIHLIKFWLTVGQEMQLKRLHDRRHDPLKRWKLTAIDLKAIAKWDAYTQARNKLFKHSHTELAPWTVIRSNDKRRARINAIRHVLSQFNYEGKDETIVSETDPLIVGNGPDFFEHA